MLHAEQAVPALQSGSLIEQRKHQAVSSGSSPG